MDRGQELYLYIEAIRDELGSQLGNNPNLNERIYIMSLALRLQDGERKDEQFEELIKVLNKINTNLENIWHSV